MNLKMGSKDRIVITLDAIRSVRSRIRVAAKELDFALFDKLLLDLDALEQVLNSEIESYIDGINDKAA